MSIEQSPSNTGQEHKPHPEEGVGGCSAVGATKDKNVPWYTAEWPGIDKGTSNVLEQYSSIPSDQVEKHVYAVRERAWDIFPYPCIGRWGFLDLGIGKAPQYDEVLERVKSGQKLLDGGCCFGQDIRKLVADGAPPENIIGTDLHAEFFDLGYDLFRDGPGTERQLDAQFIPADFLDASDSSPLASLRGTISIIHASSFFHLFNYRQQLDVAKRCITLLKEEPGSLVFGRQSGSENTGELPMKDGSSMYRHNVDTWQNFWKEVGKETGTKWRVWVEAEKPEGWGNANKVSKKWDEKESAMGRLVMKYAAWLE